ncbi:MAG: hypothetical protein DCO96_03270 [Fluviicola sp. XM-24bin1]|nr:MAG: hypothetical protein DCO96_03270 [Fluviicola sp. XM-24bin1]
MRCNNPDVKEDSQRKTPSEETVSKEQRVSFSEIRKSLRPDVQSFQWSGKRDNIITCEQGTKIFLPKNCIQKIDKNAAIEIEVKECYQLSDFISEHLTTLSDDQILETGGMIHIWLHQDDEGVTLKGDEEYAVLFPKSADNNGEMSTFYGVNDSSVNVTWQQAPS